MTETEATLPDLLREPEKKRPAWVRVLLLVGALVCFALGIVGWLVPVVTGIPFFVAALFLLGAASSRLRQWLNRAEARLPQSWRIKLRHGLRKIPIKRIQRTVQAP